MKNAPRRRQIEVAFADPPQPHPEAPRGVWRTERWCYEFIADHLPPQATTLETGCGISTVLFAQWSTQHVCVVPFASEEELTRAWLDARGLPHDHVRFEIGWSDDLLPRLEIEPLDLVLIDGGHGFPSPILDWYYACASLRRGGLAILDDINLQQVSTGLSGFLAADPRWERVDSTSKWVAYRRTSPLGHLREEWVDQPFLGGPRERGLITRLREASAHGELVRELRDLAYVLRRRARKLGR